MARNKSEQPKSKRLAISNLPGWTMENHYGTIGDVGSAFRVYDEHGVFIVSRWNFREAHRAAEILYSARLREREIAQPTRGQYQPWRWSDVEDNDLDTMSDGMEVLITAKQLRKLLEEAANPHRAIQPGQPGTMTDASRRIWSAGTFRGWHGNHGTKQK